MEQRGNEAEMRSPALAILPRLERIDRLVHLVEERRGHECWCKCKTRLILSENVDVIDNKSLSSAMEEVHHKGTLIERLEILENRVLQLWLDVEDEGVSMSTCSDSAVNEREYAAAGSTKALNPNPKERVDKAGCVSGTRKWFNVKLKLKRRFHFPMGMGCDHY